MPDEIAQITKHGALPKICDDNRNTIRMAGRANLQVELGGYRLQLEVIFCDRLAAPCILGADFCDKCVLAIGPKNLVIELEDRSTVPIVPNPSASQQTRIATGCNHDNPKLAPSRVSPEIRWPYLA